jgi:hypothetical protein
MGSGSPSETRPTVTVERMVVVDVDVDVSSPSVNTCGPAAAIGLAPVGRFVCDRSRNEFR